MQLERIENENPTSTSRFSSGAPLHGWTVRTASLSPKVTKNQHDLCCCTLQTTYRTPQRGKLQKETELIDFTHVMTTEPTMTNEQTLCALHQMKHSSSKQKEPSCSIQMTDIVFSSIDRDYFYLSIPNHCAMSRCIRQTWDRLTCLISIIKDIGDKHIIHHCWTWVLKCHTVSAGQFRQFLEAM